MKIVRRITYEVPDGVEHKLRRQMQRSLRTGFYPFLVHLTVEHLEGPRFDTDGNESLARPYEEQEVKVTECGETLHGWICTLPKDHTGKHEARGVAAECYRRW